MSSASSSRISRKGAVMKTISTKAMQKPATILQGGEVLKDVQEYEKYTELSIAKTSRKAKVSQKDIKSGHQSTTPKRKDEEKRLRRYRSKPPSSFLLKLERAQTQRMIVLGRKRKTTNGAPSEDIDIVGSTGNIYTVTISHNPTCTCPDSSRGNECKHKVYALYTVLKAPLHLQYQLAFLSSELEEIFAHAPPLPIDLGEDSKGNRKATDGECPICYMDLNEEHNKLVWCRKQCGHNMHKSCFDQWAASQGGREVRCVYCRTPWEVDVSDVDAVRHVGEHTAEGYVNVASQFGMSRARDYSSYYQPWVRRHFGFGS